MLDEPFTGMDVSVKDDLVQGLLAASSGEGCTILLSSHDIGELELLVDWVGFLGDGSMKLSETMESMRERFKHVDVMLASDRGRVTSAPADWLSVDQSARHLKFVVSNAGPAFESVVRGHFPDALRVETREATLKEIFVALQRRERSPFQGAPL